MSFTYQQKIIRGLTTERCLRDNGVKNRRRQYRPDLSLVDEQHDKTPSAWKVQRESNGIHNRTSPTIHDVSFNWQINAELVTGSKSCEVHVAAAAAQAHQQDDIDDVNLSPKKWYSCLSLLKKRSAQKYTTSLVSPVQWRNECWRSGTSHNATWPHGCSVCVAWDGQARWCVNIVQIKKRTKEYLLEDLAQSKL